MMQWQKAGRTLKWWSRPSSATEVHWVTQWSLVKSAKVNADTGAHYKPHASQQNQDKLQAEIHWLSWQQGWLSLGLSKMPSACSLLCWLTLVSCPISTAIQSSTTQLLFLYKLQIWAQLMAAVEERSVTRRWLKCKKNRVIAASLKHMTSYHASLPTLLHWYHQENTCHIIVLKVSAEYRCIL